MFPESTKHRRGRGRLYAVAFGSDTHSVKPAVTQKKKKKKKKKRKALPSLADKPDDADEDEELLDEPLISYALLPALPRFLAIFGVRAVFCG